MKRSKKYKSVLNKIDNTKRYTLNEALKISPEISLSKFAGSINLQLFLNLNDKQKKESIRGSYTLPHSFGKTIKVLAIVDKSEISKAKSADISGSEELLKDIEENKIEFDILLTSPLMMPKLARLGKILGAKGLMPNPKNGTITNNIEESIKKFKSGMKNFKSVNASPINAVIGKTDMKLEELENNANSFIKSVLIETRKYNSTPIKRAILNVTMGPKIELDINSINS